MRALGFDTETDLIRPAHLAPNMVCLTWQLEGEKPGICHHKDAEARFRAWLEDPNVLFVGAHTAFDMAVVGARFPHLLPLIFAAYDADRVTDVQIRQKLLDIAGGVYRGRLVGKNVWIPLKYALEDIAWRCAGIRLQKDAWRMSYVEFIDTPLEQWRTRALEVQAEAKVKLVAREAQLACTPNKEGTTRKALQKEIDGLHDMIASAPEQCIKYPIEDATATLAVYQAQEKHKSYLADQFRQSRAAFALYLSSAWGLRTDLDGVNILRADTLARLEENEQDLQEAGLVKANGVKDTKAAKALMIDICEREGLDLRRTDGHDKDNLTLAERLEQGLKPKCKDKDGKALDDGDDRCVVHVALGKDDCDAVSECYRGHLLVAYAELTADKRTLSNDVVALEKGVVWPIHTRYDMAETARTTSSKPNIQNWARGRKCRVCDGKGEVQVAA